jgi:hypothetical protein
LRQPTWGNVEILFFSHQCKGTWTWGYVQCCWFKKQHGIFCCEINVAIAWAWIVSLWACEHVSLTIKNFLEYFCHIYIIFLPYIQIFFVYVAKLFH